MLLVCAKLFLSSPSFCHPSRCSSAFLLSSFRSSTHSNSFSTMSSPTIVLDAFGKRQFNNPEYTGTQIHFSEADFEKRINEYFANGYALKNGYAPFCKHLFVPNFVNATCGYAAVTEENKHLIQSAYEARTELELPVLIQYFDKEKVPAPTATFLDIILYSREQIILENQAMGTVANIDPSVEWGIISVKAQLCDFELPMQPITAMRNALGKEHGGSGVPLDRKAYAAAVDFWTKNVAIK